MTDPDFQAISDYQPKDGEEFMNSNQVEHFRSKLLAWRDQLLDGVESTKHHIQEDSAKVADINDRATLEEEFALELRTRDRERKLGDYGYCKTCGTEISLVRLEARPTADECIDCKTIAEKKEV
jgi:DnaK suppressor protein